MGRYLMTGQGKNIREGTHRGYPWVERRLCDVFTLSSVREPWYFLIDPDTLQPTGSHFRHLKDLEAYVDARSMSAQEGGS